MSTDYVRDDSSARTSDATVPERLVDAVVIGTGFGGLYALHKLRDTLGLDVQVLEEAPDVGGTWYWNTFPGARSDSGSAAYCFSFDREIGESWQWKERFPAQPEMAKYFKHVADKHDFRRSIAFNSRVTSTTWDDTIKRWTVVTESGATWRAQFLIEGLGVLTAPNIPPIPGQESFAGEVYHSARWPQAGVDLKGKRVGVIGSGSTGIQILTAIAPVVGELYSFQRSPQWVLPAGHGSPDASVVSAIKEDHDGYFRSIRESFAAFGWDMASKMADAVSAEEARAALEEQWNRGGSLQFMGGVFQDILVSRSANKVVTDFMAEKIRKIVKDPEVAERLIPTELFARRPIQEDGYYDIFNQENVTLVSLRQEPILQITQSGLQTSSREIELDVLIYATGFNAHSGAYLAIDQRGKGGISLSEHWAERPRAFMGAMTAGFPNWFMTLGPLAPFANYPPATFVIVDWVVDLIKYVRDSDAESVELTLETEKAWIERCDALAKGNFMVEAVPSWLNGGNIPGKKQATTLFFGGLYEMDAEFHRVAQNNYEELKFE